jgi:hypothetical protein
MNDRNQKDEITLADISPSGRLYSCLVVGSLTDEEWETVKAEIRSQGEIPEDWRELGRRAGQATRRNRAL